MTTLRPSTPATDDSSVLMIRHHIVEDVQFMRYGLVAVHIDAHADLLDQPFYSAERFSEQLDECLKEPGFELVSGRVDGLLVGCAFGTTLSADTSWWQGIRDCGDPDLIRENGNRTFAFREILVRKAYQHQGYAHRLHDALLAERHEDRAALLVSSDNPARELYLRWGWEVAGKVQPSPDSPLFEAMVIDRWFWSITSSVETA
jgi:GNAT superfamily N-acetyltransferase